MLGPALGIAARARRGDSPGPPDSASRLSTLCCSQQLESLGNQGRNPGTVPERPASSSLQKPHAVIMVNKR